MEDKKTLEQLQQEFSQVAARVGFKAYQMFVFDQEIEQMCQLMRETDLIAAKVKAEEDAAKVAAPVAVVPDEVLPAETL